MIQMICLDYRLPDSNSRAVPAKGSNACRPRLRGYADARQEAGEEEEASAYELPVIFLLERRYDLKIQEVIMLPSGDRAGRDVGPDRSADNEEPRRSEEAQDLREGNVVPPLRAQYQHSACIGDPGGGRKRYSEHIPAKTRSS